MDITCKACNQTKPETKFFKHKGRRKTTCRECEISSNPNIRARRRRQGKNKEASMRYKALMAYMPPGAEKPACGCCGESIYDFLQLDHVNRDGADHRRMLEEQGISRGNFLRYLYKNNFPKDPPLRVLCANCNVGREKNNGICPHELSRNPEITIPTKPAIIPKTGKINAKLARLIVRLSQSGISPTEICKTFGVSRPNIYLIKSGKIWTEETKDLFELV